MQPPGEAIAALLDGTHADPFALLGVHAGPDGTFARAILPGAEAAEAFSLKGKSQGKLTRVDPRGLFEGKLKGKPQPVKYRCSAAGNEWWVTDPYSFGPVMGPTDDFLIAEGTHQRLFDKLGAHLITHQGASGVHFAVWAPNARFVSVVGDFNDWDHRRHLMRERLDIGVWEIFIPDLAEGRAYKYRIVGPDVAIGHAAGHHDQVSGDRMRQHVDRVLVDGAEQVGGQDLLWGPDGSNCAICEHHDPVRSAHGGEAVGDHQRGAVLHQAFERLLDELFALGIQGAGRFVEQQDRRIAQQRAGDGDALLLAAGKLRAPFA